ncbi:claudin-23-like [Myxocyprinus asiaticus]|uniref:claudin-23-like n=1 Tax=Myxocyprinus asiaticus TaxID=70543 RepID=UPI00222147F8|nr:claudin-23-like [Myxocyprinus asiaticus]XP_051502689.1 claudin-23-like [Myxocyprinus asiaticus]XP_051502690.1 claudin-23-like [Myxocyprinus asiaticus]XP_051502691.1 claudin-23-like [Myxocyprinus asiaticus]XP_051502692.1 claudin-23-like [Myxocyprinus asiaticus]XP_051502693.1 claudin-23-like [Myxocyprinus asiaticus]XP_051502694.1 claudin-23-like [Myxocyprinus asiaticus]XP_051502695.1 claudin-23-like [Myxocyprinus asiaticus]
MHTPVSILMGVVFAPLGLVLVFTAAITPQWREGQARLGAAERGGATELLLLRSDGLWESCLQVVHSELKECWPVSGSYQRDARVRLVQGMVLSSLFLCGAGIVLASVGVRCWTDIPLRSVAAAGGLLVVLAGMLSLAALGVYTRHLSKLGIEVDSTVSEMQELNIHNPPRLTLHPAGSLYFGWVGAWVQVLGGAALLFGFKSVQCPSCPKQNLKDSAEMYEVNC